LREICKNVTVISRKNQAMQQPFMLTSSWQWWHHCRVCACFAQFGLFWLVCGNI